MFADFDVNEYGRLHLVRISFDGYGCCLPDPSVGIGELDIEKSQQIIRSIEGDELDAPEIMEILKNYFRENRAVLWEDALKVHELI